MHSKRALDPSLRPSVVVWEPTRACDVACLHCRTAPQPAPSQFELSTYEGYKLIDQVAELAPQTFVFSGGDPLKRGDIYEFVNYASRRGLRPTLTPSATPLLSREAVVKLKEAGLARLAVTVDGSSAELHDGFRGVPGAWDRTMDAIRWAREVGLAVQINTNVTRKNLADLEAIGTLLEMMDVTSWSLFFLVPGGRVKPSDVVTAWEAEDAFGTLYEVSRHVSFEVRTIEAAHYRRFVLQQLMNEMNVTLPELVKKDGSAIADAAGRGDTRGFVFISHTGEVYPSSFLPLPAGNVRHRRLSEIYKNSPLFLSLRDPHLLKGKCGICEYREICGGSRARAYAVTRDPLAEEPLCVYLPSALQTRPHPELRSV